MEEVKLLFHQSMFDSTVMWSQCDCEQIMIVKIIPHRLEELQFFIRLLQLSEVPVLFFVAWWKEASAFSFVLHVYEFGTLCNLNTGVWDGALGFAVSEDRSY